jgi:serine/threonine protein kinase
MRSRDLEMLETPQHCSISRRLEDLRLSCLSLESVDVRRHHLCLLSSETQRTPRQICESQTPGILSRTVQTICAQIEGIINGLQYIHSLNVIHGDIKSVRVTSKQLFL